jgi:prepilin-type N-terminal cleavage/methylation domain-containing protein
MKKTTQGFTLIELLVVIAIIGILSSIVIASLNSARTKGSVAAAKGQLAQLRTQAENYYDNNGGYASSSVTTAQTTCNAANTMFADATITTQITQIGTNVLATNCGMSADRQKFHVAVQLKDSTFWCVDNQGGNKAATAIAPTTTGTCN